MFDISEKDFEATIEACLIAGGYADPTSPGYIEGQVMTDTAHDRTSLIYLALAGRIDVREGA